MCTLVQEDENDISPITRCKHGLEHGRHASLMQELPHVSRSAASPLSNRKQSRQPCSIISIILPSPLTFSAPSSQTMNPIPPPNSTSSMTEALENAPTVAASAPEPQADHIQYLTPTPPGFAPEYDYFAVVQSLIDTAGIRESDSSDESPFQPLDELLKNRKDTLFGSGLMRSSWLGRLLHLPVYPRQAPVEEMYEEIQEIRRLLIGETQGGKNILVIDNISPAFLQILGAAIDLDPTFVWRHYIAAPDSLSDVPEMDTLRRKFLSLVPADSKRRAERKRFYVSSTDKDLSVHLRYWAFNSDWAGRVHTANEISSHISCHSVTDNSCEYPLLLRLIIS